MHKLGKLVSPFSLPQKLLSTIVMSPKLPMQRLLVINKQFPLLILKYSKLISPSPTLPRQFEPGRRFIGLSCNKIIHLFICLS